MSRSVKKGVVVTAGLILLVFLCGGALFYWMTPRHTSISPTRVSPSSPGTHTEASWAFPFVRWNGHMYVITPEPVQSQQIGKFLGTVTHFSDKETPEESGTFSNFLPVGTKLYEMEGVSSAKFIVVEQEKGYFVEASVHD